jgi:hypothetical protein
MSESNAPDVVAPIEMLAEWEGPAQLNPSVFAGPKELDGFLADPGLIGEAATWVAVTAGSAILGNSVYDSLKNKVIGFLTAWRRRHGQKRLDDLKQKVLDAFDQGKADPEETRRRIDALFAEAEK